MENNMLLNIWSNDTFSYEDKISLSKEFVKELKEKEKSEEYDETYDKYNDNQKPIVKKVREQAAKVRETVKRIENEQKLVKESVRLNRIFDEKVKKLKELNNIVVTTKLDMYEDLMEKTKTFVNGSNTEYNYDMSVVEEYKDYVNNEFKKYFREEAVDLEKEEQSITDKPEKRKTIVPRLEDNLKKMKENSQDENVIVNEEDGSRFTKFKGFLKKHWKKVLLAAGIIGGAVLAYNLIKQGQTDSAHDVTNMIDTTAKQLKGDINHMQSIHDQMSDLGQRTDVGNIDNTFYTNDDAAQSINSLSPNEYHQNHILGAVTDGNERLPADNMQDVYNYADQGKHITSLEVGGYNDTTGTVEIDGHVNTIDGVRLEDDIKNYQNLSDGGKLK